VLPCFGTRHKSSAQKTGTSIFHISKVSSASKWRKTLEKLAQSSSAQQKRLQLDDLERSRQLRSLANLRKLGMNLLEQFFGSTDTVWFRHLLALVLDTDVTVIAGVQHDLEH